MNFGESATLFRATMTYAVANLDILTGQQLSSSSDRYG